MNKDFSEIFKEKKRRKCTFNVTLKTVYLRNIQAKGNHNKFFINKNGLMIYLECETHKIHKKGTVSSHLGTKCYSFFS